MGDNAARLLRPQPKYAGCVFSAQHGAAPTGSWDIICFQPQEVELTLDFGDSATGTSITFTY